MKKATAEIITGDMRLENGGNSEKAGRSKQEGWKEESGESQGSTPKDVKMESAVPSPTRRRSSTNSLNDPLAKHEEVVGGEVTLKVEHGQPPKLSRSSSRKMIAGPVQLFGDAPDRTEEARNTFQVLSTCSYSSKYIGSSKVEEDLECDCSEEWGKESSPRPVVNYPGILTDSIDSVNRVNLACGDDDVCINRATKMECYGDCGW